MLGGYGGFGARITRRLVEQGHEVLVAGRSLERAQALCEALREALKQTLADQARRGPAPQALAVDRTALGPTLATWRPALLVDASGPFQTMDHGVPAACIAAGIGYCDIADSRGFVTSIRELDALARAAGVTVISGASSVPALSGAVVRTLADGLEQVRAVEIAISASQQATGGPAVTAAILGQVGLPFGLRRGRREDKVRGWSELRTLRFEVPGRPPLTDRLVALLDVPDLALLPGRLPGRPAVSFRAGAGSGLQNRALALAGLLVRAGWLPGLSRCAPVLTRLQHVMRRTRDDRSAMIVRVFGDRGGVAIERRWTLIAEQGHGPEIPTLAAPLLVAKMLGGTEPPGARDAGTSLTLPDFEASFAHLALHHAIEEHAQVPPVYARLLGADFDRLPPRVRALRDVRRDGGAVGTATVLRAQGALATWVARLMSFPPAGEHTLHVSVAEEDGVERWERDFSGHCFVSHLSVAGDRLIERFGPLRFSFELKAGPDGLVMVMRGWSAFGMPLPLWLAPRTRTREWQADDRYQFEVEISMPGIGHVVTYRGWLTPADA